MDPIGAALERILDALESAQPERLPSKKKVFREDSDGYLNVRSEFNVGYSLTETGTRFAFGGPGQPDYICTLGEGSPGYVEVTTRPRDDLPSSMMVLTTPGSRHLDHAPCSSTPRHPPSSPAHDLRTDRRCRNDAQL